MAHTCPNCGHVYTPEPKAKAPRLVPATDPSLMSDRELYAYYKRTAPIEDLRFFIRNAVKSPALQAASEALEAAYLCTSVSPQAFKAEYLKLRALWRRERNAADLQAHLEAGHTYDRQYSRWIEPKPIQAETEAVA